MPGLPGSSQLSHRPGQARRKRDSPGPLGRARQIAQPLARNTKNSSTSKHSRSGCDDLEKHDSKLLHSVAFFAGVHHEVPHF
ncbi:hypothetical protein RMSM_05391 [Rhodopirellula maiorica SM1]|uniref:Uncharacterized protein n=1 Tax=Rhodopirellula maiorica SM1 TaxID=1265738 RepID=M5RUQ0_9BACT|nr:hypothetical protein RMSM_05391 [Rhodopirellula maiorica SM1]